MVDALEVLIYLLSEGSALNKWKNNIFEQEYTVYMLEYTVNT